MSQKSAWKKNVVMPFGLLKTDERRKVLLVPDLLGASRQEFSGWYGGNSLIRKGNAARWLESAAVADRLLN